MPTQNTQANKKALRTAMRQARKDQAKEPLATRKKTAAADDRSFGLAEDLTAALLAAGEPLSAKQLETLFADRYGKKELRTALAGLQRKYHAGALVLNKTASGYVFHITGSYAAKVRRMAEDAPPRYSRALMETLAIIAYKQPITKSEIEDLRGVTLSGNIMRTLQEHEWIKIVGHKQVPGRPAVWGTTGAFLDSFNLQKLSELPPLPATPPAKEPLRQPVANANNDKLEERAKKPDDPQVKEEEQSLSSA